MLYRCCIDAVERAALQYSMKRAALGNTAPMPCHAPLALQCSNAAQYNQYSNAAIHHNTVCNTIQSPSGLRSPCGSSGGGRAATQRPPIGQLARVACHACLRVPGRVRGTAKRPLHARRHVDSPQAGRRARCMLAHIAVVTPPLRPYPPPHGLRTVLRVVCTCVYVRVRSCRGGDAVE